MMNEADILHEDYSSYLTRPLGKESTGLLCIVAYHHEIIVELREYGFYSFPEASVAQTRGSQSFGFNRHGTSKEMFATSKRFCCIYALR